MPGDTQTILETLPQAGEHIAQVACTTNNPEEGERGFDEFVEQCCAAFYAKRMGRPSVRPGRYFRMLLIGYFEGIDSERGIAWRTADSLALRSFLGLGIYEMPPDHSTISRTRRLIDVETHAAVFHWVLELPRGLGEAGSQAPKERKQ